MLQAIVVTLGHSSSFASLITMSAVHEANGSESCNCVILDGLPPNTHKHQFTGMAAMMKKISEELEYLRSDAVEEASEYVIFSHVDSQRFIHDVLESDEKVSWDSYCKSSGLLLIEMPTPAHEKAYSGLFALIVAELAQVGLESSLEYLGSSDVRGNTRTKRPDCSFLPVDVPEGRSGRWPSLVVEAAITESKAKLMSDVNFWLRESDGDVQITLAILAPKGSSKITIQKWELVNSSTSSDPACRAVTLTQQVDIQKQDRDVPHVTNAPLRIEFEKLFLRQPSGAEQDIQISADKLGRWARRIWSNRYLY